MPRIAILFEYPTVNGGENSMLAAVDAMSDGDFEFLFLAPPHGRLAERLRTLGLCHVPLALHDERGQRLPRDRACSRIEQAVRDCSPDLLHANSLAMGRLTGAVSVKLGIPCIAHLRDIIGLSDAAIADLNCNAVLLAVSRAARDFHVAQGLAADRVRVLYNGVDCSRFQPRPRTDALRNELRLDGSAFLTAIVGQIGLRKGHDVLVAAACLLAERLPDVHYLVVGERNSNKDESIDFERKVVARFQDAGLGSRLHRLGYRDDIERVLNEVDLLVHPAHQEPFGRVLLEAAAAGTPIVATNVGGTAELLEDGRSARLVPAGDATALAAAIVELHDDRPKRDLFSAAARQRVLADFTIEWAAKNLVEVWGEVLESS